MAEQRNFPANLLRFAKQSKGILALSVLAAFCGVACGMIPYFAVSAMIVGLMNGGADMEGMLPLFLWALAGYAGRVMLTAASAIMSHKAAFSIIRTIREDMSRKLARMPLGDVMRMPSGKLKSLMVDTVEKMEAPLAHIIPELTSNIFIPLGIACYLFVLDWRMGLAAIATFPVGVLCYMGMTKDYGARFDRVRQAGRDMNAAVVEYINGIETIKAFNLSTRSYAKYVGTVEKNCEVMTDWFRSCSGYFTAGLAIAPASLLTVLPAALLFYSRGSLAPSTAVVCVILSLGLIGPLIQALEYTDSLAMMGDTVSDVCSLLDAPELVRPSRRADVRDDSVSFDNVSFAYGRDNVLHNVSFSMKEGEITAIVGASGSGKSTLAKLVAGFWDVGQGRILLGGVDMQSMPLAQSMERVAYISQDNFLFNTSIRENILVGKPGAADEEIVAASRAAACHDFIMALPFGYDTRVGDAGRQLSGGERQRLTIARAMLKDSPIIVLDEATAFTDPQNEAHIQKSINNLVKHRTLLVIAHRLSTIMHAARIVVMDQGRVSAVGTHAELLQWSNIYRQLWGIRTGSDLTQGEGATAYV
ncbi:MAG: ABC transporter ATP-binding protein/permease [Desulfovibrio sp.]|nr:ABC transporter ATP-binding protein/permease [Desulfovibrio sp.]